MQAPQKTPTKCLPVPCNHCKDSSSLNDSQHASPHSVVTLSHPGTLQVNTCLAWEAHWLQIRLHHGHLELDVGLVQSKLFVTGNNNELESEYKISPTGEMISFRGRPIGVQLANVSLIALWVTTSSIGHICQ